MIVYQRTISFVRHHCWSRLLILAFQHWNLNFFIQLDAILSYYHVCHMILFDVPVTVYIFSIIPRLHLRKPHTEKLWPKRRSCIVSKMCFCLVSLPIQTPYMPVFSPEQTVTHTASTTGCLAMKYLWWHKLIVSHLGLIAPVWVNTKQTIPQAEPGHMIVSQIHQTAAPSLQPLPISREMCQMHWKHRF